MSATVFSITNQKGGTGKTTLTMNFAAGLSHRGRTLVIDADPQRSASQWTASADRSKPFPVSVIAVAGNLEQEVERFRRDYQYIVIDCPPSLESDIVELAMFASDIMLIPVLPSPVDLWASVRLADLVEQVRRRKRDLTAYIVVNQLEPRNALSRAMKEALTEFEIPALESSVRRRAIYRNAAIGGSSVFCVGKQGQPAAEEIDAIIDEVVGKTHLN